MHKASHDASLQNVAPNQKHISTILDTNLLPIILLKNVNIAIDRDSGGVFHLNKDRKMSKSEIERMASAVGTSNSQHKQLVPWAQMNTSKEHFSPTNGEILPQNDGKIVHVTKNNIKRLDRLKTRNSEILGNTSLDVSDRARRLPSHSDTSQTMPTTSSVGSTAGEILPQNADNFAQNLDQSAPSPRINFSQGAQNPRVNITPASEEPQNFTQPNPRVSITQGADFNATQNQEQAGVSGIYQRGKYLFTKDANGNELIQDPKTGQWHIYN